MAHSAENPDLQDLRRLTLEKCTDTLTVDGAAELSSLLASSAAARREYLEIMSVHAKLAWELGKNSLRANAMAELGAALVELKASEARRKRVLGWGSALAASLLLAITLGYWNFMRNGGPSALGPGGEHATAGARVVGAITPLTDESRWSFGRPGGAQNREFCRGDTVSLERGEIELRLSNNTVAVMRAPVVMQVVSLDRVRVLQGRIKVDVAKGAEGFTVETDSAEVVDLGTVFSVGVVEGETDIVVFDGEVDLKYGREPGDALSPASAATKRFQAGEAVHVSRDGTLSRIVSVQQATNDLQNGSRPQVIQSVKDDIQRDDMFSFYEIVPDGIAEDAQAYVDRRHEWNGVTAEGVPSYLLGADYVKTFCDDKLNSNMVIDLELQAPAVVYIFLDNRVSVPDWLAERFRKTGDVIGLDESYVDPGRGELALQGPGNGINQEFSVWEMVASEGGVVRLGPNGEPTPEELQRGLRAKAVMYGIAAVRLNEGP